MGHKLHAGKKNTNIALLLIIINTVILTSSFHLLNTHGMPGTTLSTQLILREPSSHYLHLFSTREEANSTKIPELLHGSLYSENPIAGTPSATRHERF